MDAARQSRLTRAIPLAVAGVGLAMVLAWWLADPGRLLKPRVPGTDRDESEAGAGGGQWAGKLIKGAGVPADLKGEWPRFRGAHLDGISTDPTPLARAWPENGPKVLWKTDVGEGFAGAVLWRGRVYVLDYDQKERADALRCLSLADGKEIWRYTYPSKVKRNHGMSRTIPSVDDKRIVSLGPKCQVICLNPVSGELLWQMNLVREFNTEVPPWYAGQCPLVDDGKLILGTGGDALIAAVDCADGKVLWKSRNPRNWQMTHSSVLPVEFKGKRMYVYCASGGVAAVSAADGTLLWETPDWKISIANVPTPVYVGEGRLFLCGGYNAGSVMLQMVEKDGKYSVEPVLRLKATVFGATQQTPIIYQNRLFGVRPDGQFACLDLAGKPVWESGAARKFGNGPFMLAQGLLFAMNDEGLLTMAEADSPTFKPLAQARVLAGPDAWGPMALADGRLVLRDLNQMICLDVAHP